MESKHDVGSMITQPAISDLMAQFLQKQAFHALEGAVTPFDACPVMPVDSRLAWDGALAALECFQPDTNFSSRKLMPPDWPALVAGHEPVASLTMAAANFPQLVRSLHNLVHARDFSTLAPAGSRPLNAPTLAGWSREVALKKEFPSVLIAAGVLRLARHFDQAADLLGPNPSHVPAEWRAAWQNERAALAWHRGDLEEARTGWQTQDGSVPVHFNRGVAALFSNKPADARRWLNEAVGQLNEDDPWRHLGLLYIALAEMRS